MKINLYLCTTNNEIMKDYKSRYIVLIVLVILLVYQGYWLYSLYNKRKHEIKDEIYGVIECSDYQEMEKRASFLGHSLGASVTLDVSPNNKNEKLASFKTYIRHLHDSKIVTIEKVYKCETVRNTGVSVNSKKDSLDNPYKIIADDTRNQLHVALDSVKMNDLRYFYTLLRKNLKKVHLDCPLCIFYYSDGRLRAKYIEGGCQAKSLSETFIYGFGDHKAYYTIVLSCFPILVLRDMTGIIICSLLLWGLIAFSLWYLRKNIHSLHALDEMKTDFTNNVSHELKTPIAVAYAANDALLNYGIAKDPDKLKKYLTISLTELKQLEKLVEEILSMSMEKRVNMQLSYVYVNIHNTVMNIVEMEKMKAKKPVSFTINVDAEEMLWTDQKHFSHILENIIDNAIKYSADKAEVSISLKRDENFIVIAISDKGIGIERKNLHSIFDKFYRVPHENLHDVKGYGLGLYYVKCIMQKLDGTIDIESEPNVGTTVKLIFERHE